MTKSTLMWLKNALPVHPEVLRKSFLFRENWNGEDSKTEEYSNQTQKGTFQEKTQEGLLKCWQELRVWWWLRFEVKMVKMIDAQAIFDRTWHVLKVLLSGFAVVVESSALLPKGEAGSAILLWKGLKICIFACNLDLPWGFSFTVLTRRKVNWLTQKIANNIEANVFWERVEPWMRTRLNSSW